MQQINSNQLQMKLFLQWNYREAMNDEPMVYTKNQTLNPFLVQCSKYPSVLADLIHTYNMKITYHYHNLLSPKNCIGVKYKLPIGAR